jgi:predicted ester cyclase
MVADHASLLVAYLEAGDSQAYEALRDVLTPDIVTHTAGGSKLIGIDAHASTWRTAHQGLSRLRHRLIDEVDGSGVVAGRVLVTGVHTGTFLGIPPTGRRIEVDQALFARVERGRIGELWEIVDTGSGLRQLGVLGNQAIGLEEG